MFRLVALAHYEGTVAQWQNVNGENSSVTRVLRDELSAPIGRYEAARGGGGAISYAFRKREAEGRSFVGTYLRVAFCGAGLLARASTNN
ncbi:hypothetical protein Pla123a_07500 [Posidoniimonas polymericola]|uniref:Uncharacterized protein n=1 Tax=Posidoniimonas polymericola TaxID=2528002 RepID=A0A5C5ZHB5_9BACT|nr:hypothetical protein [Posidoniimonas polymericola]TWT85943.1 hypothetical protein Pla123a_07500 [Posidoniimonas polymericola]